MYTYIHTDRCMCVEREREQTINTGHLFSPPWKKWFQDQIPANTKRLYSSERPGN